MKDFIAVKLISDYVSGGYSLWGPGAHSPRQNSGTNTSYAKYINDPNSKIIVPL